VVAINGQPSIKKRTHTVTWTGRRLPESVKARKLPWNSTGYQGGRCMTRQDQA